MLPEIARCPGCGEVAHILTGRYDLLCADCQVSRPPSEDDSASRRGSAEEETPRWVALAMVVLIFLLGIGMYLDWSVGLHYLP